MKNYSIIILPTHFLFLVSCLLVFTSCHSQCIDKINSSIVESDSVVKDIPVDKYGNDDLYFKATKKRTTILGLKSIDSGFDSLQIRVWYPEMKKNKMVILSRTPKKWKAYLFTFDLEYDLNTRIDSFVNIKCKELTPQSGWQKFTQELFSFDITSLPNVDDIPGIPGAGTDGETYFVEVASIHQYRFYSYNQPMDYPEIEPVRKMANIIRLLNKEFELTQ